MIRYAKGLAKNILEKLPDMTPKIILKAKCLRSPLPNIYIAITTNSTDHEVINDLVIVSQRLFSNISAMLFLVSTSRCSLILSKIIIVSLIL